VRLYRKKIYGVLKVKNVLVKYLPYVRDYTICSFVIYNPDEFYASDCLYLLS